MDGTRHRHSRPVLALLALLVGGSLPAQATETQPPAATSVAEPASIVQPPATLDGAPAGPAPVAPAAVTRALSRCPQWVRNSGYELCAPAPLDDLGRGFQHCRRGRQVHPAVDIRGELGTPLRAIARARVTMVGLPDEQPGQFGLLDKRPGTVVRDGIEFPRSKDVPGYGRVYFFTRSKGSWRAGGTVVMEGLGGGLEGHEIRYMHMAAVHPSIRPGVVVEPGQEIGLLGGTAVQRTLPHLHLDARDPDGRPLDLKSLLTGTDPVGYCGGPMLAKKGGKGKSGKVLAKGKGKPKGKAPAAIAKAPAKGKNGVLVRTSGTGSGPSKIKKGPRPERKRPAKPARSS